MVHDVYIPVCQIALSLYFYFLSSLIIFLQYHGVKAAPFSPISKNLCHLQLFWQYDDSKLRPTYL
jgi:hypothetical protein